MKIYPDWNICKTKASRISLNDNSIILDVGSNNGKKIDYVLGTRDVVKLDINFRKNLSPFVKGDATHLPFRDNSFDLVTFFHVLEHIKNDKMALTEIYRVLKKDGTLLLVTPNAKRLTTIYSFFYKMVMRRPHKYPLNPDHVFEYSSSDIENIMKGSKFNDYLIEPIFMRISTIIRIRNYCDQWIVTAKK